MLQTRRGFLQAAGIGAGSLLVAPRLLAGGPKPKRKPNVIIIFTDVIDDEASSMLLDHMARFARYHLPLCVTLRNLEVEAVAKARPQRSRDCFNQAVAVDMLGRRAKALAKMRSCGVDVLDIDAHQLTPNLIERYLTFKERQQI